MKRKLILLSLAVLTGVMSGCGNKAASIGIIGGGAAEESSIDSRVILKDDDSQETVQEAVQEAKDGTGVPRNENSRTDMPGTQIEDQSFDVNLDGWGDVTFAAFWPEDLKTGDGDVRFKLLKNGGAVFDFPGITEDNRRSGQWFGIVAAVSFKDYNNDGKKDIIIISEYAPGSRPDESYHEVRFYTQAGGKKEFHLDDGPMLEFLQKNRYSDSIQEVMKGIEEFRKFQNAEPAAQSGEIDKQIRIMTDNRDLWAGTMDSEGVTYFYTVTDLDKNGRLELITSSNQGSGLFTYSNYFEVNESFDGLAETGRNRQEGSSDTDIIAGSALSYYNPQSRITYYVFDNFNRNGKENYESKSAVSLENGVIIETPLAHKSSIPEGQSVKVTYRNAEGKEISETEYNNTADTVYNGYEKRNVSFLWNKADSGEALKSLSSENLSSLLLKSYKKFSEQVE